MSRAQRPPAETVETVPSLVDSRPLGRTDLTGHLWQAPGAVVLDGELSWTEAVAVIPSGTRYLLEGDVEPRPRRLRESSVSATSHFLALAGFDVDGPGAAQHLADHARRYWIPDLCPHGLPESHCWTMGGGEVAAAHRAAVALDALRGGFHGVRQRNPLSVRRIDDLLSWPVLPNSAQWRSEAERDGGRLTRGRSRALLDQWATAALAACGVTPGVFWATGSGFPLVSLGSATGMGLHLLNVIQDGGRDEPAPPTSCEVCGAPVVLSRRPRAGDGIYCRAETCQRERRRINKQRTRAVAATEGVAR